MVSVLCELLGMSANTPTDICFSFSGLVQRGGKTGPHRDGWGIAFYEGRAFREFKDSQASVKSDIAHFVKKLPIKSHVVISHIRQANSGKVCLENTHPFSRELWGRSWVFAHNGQLKGFKKKPLGFYKPIGSTDSEHAFCWILDQVRSAYPEPPKNSRLIWKLVHDLCLEVDEYGIFNMLLSDSRFLYVYCSSKLCWITRKAPFGKARLKDSDFVIDFAEHTTSKDVVTVISTEPLTGDENWETMKKGEMLVFQKGKAVYHK